MSIQLEKPKSLISLSTSAVLVSVHTSVWTGVQTDEEVSDEITTAKKAARDSGKFSKFLLAGDKDHKKLVNHRQTVRNWVKRCTFPWARNWGVLPIIELPKFMSEFNALDAEMKRLRDAFLAVYPQRISDAAFTLNGMFKREDYPTAEQLVDRFKISLYTAEVPQGDFRVKITEDLAEDLTTHFNRQAQNAIDSILSKQIDSLVTVMRSISDTCAPTVKQNEDGTVKITRGRLHSETLEKAIAFCDTFRQFNPTGDTRLDSIRMDLERVLLNTNMDDLKKNDSTRAYVKKEMDDILSKYGFDA